MKANIKRLRLEHKGTKSALAKALGLTITEYTELEDGVVEPSVEQVQKLAYIYNVAEDVIMVDDEAKEEVQVQNKKSNSVFSKTLNIFIIVLTSIYLVLNVMPLINGVAYLDMLQAENPMLYKVAIGTGMLSTIYALTLSIAYICVGDNKIKQQSSVLSLVCMIASYVTLLFGVIFAFFVRNKLATVMTLLLVVVTILNMVNYLKVKRRNING